MHPTIEKKINEAKEKSKNGTGSEKSYILSDLIKIFTHRGNSMILASEDRYRILEAIFSIDKPEGMDRFYQIRDMLPFVSEQEKIELVDCMRLACVNYDTLGIEPLDAVNFAISIYLKDNLGLEDIFIKLLESDNFIVFKNAFCFLMTYPAYISQAMKKLTTYIGWSGTSENNALDMIFLLKHRSKCGTALGLKSSFCNKVLPVVVGELETSFIANLSFYNNRDFSMIHRVNAANYILNKYNEYSVSDPETFKKFLTDEQKNAIVKEIFDFAMDECNRHNERSNCLDMILRTTNDPEIRRTVRDKIKQLGKENGDYIDDIFKTVYHSAENAHDVSDSVEDHVDNVIFPLLSDPTSDLYNSDFDDVHSECYELIGQKLEGNRKYLAGKGLRRIKHDSGLYGTNLVCIRDVFNYVWLQVQKSPEEENKNFLIDRLFEELQEMAEWCGTGHVNRLLNVIGVAKISFQDEIHGSVVSGIRSRIDKKSPDEQDVLYNAPASPDPDEKKMLENFLNEIRGSLLDEIISSYKDVTEISEEQIHDHFDEKFNEWYGYCYM